MSFIAAPWFSRRCAVTRTSLPSPSTGEAGSLGGALTTPLGDLAMGPVVRVEPGATVADAARDAGREAHRLKGLARFRHLRDGGLWAPIAPVHNVIMPLAREEKKPREAAAAAAT